MAVVVVVAILLIVATFIMDTNPFSARRADMRVSSLGGGNAALLFAVIETGQMLWRSGPVVSGFDPRGDAGALLAVLACLIILLVLMEPVARPLLTLAGMFAALANITAQGGPAEAAAFGILCLLLVTFTALLRGFIPGRK